MPRREPNEYRIEGETVILKSTRGKEILISRNDFETVRKWYWGIASSDSGGECLQVREYVIRRIGKTRPADPKFGRNIMLHRFIMDAPRDVVVDHINHDTLDNRRENLRLCTTAENGWNLRPFLNKHTKTSRYKGVALRKERSHCRCKWLVHVAKNGSNKRIGTFKEEYDAAQIYNFVAAELYGEFACLNEIR